METKKSDSLRRCGTAAAAGVGAFALPAIALAEDSQGGGMGLLLPKIGEFIPACIAFAIIWFLLAKFAWPIVLKAMDDRENKIKTDLDDAERSKKDAAASAEEYKAKISEADRKAEEIVAEAKKEAEAQRSEIIAKAQEDAAQIITKAHGAVDAERHKAMIELSGSVVDLSVEIASKIVGDNMSQDQQRKLAEKYLTEVGSLNGK